MRSCGASGTSPRPARERSVVSTGIRRGAFSASARAGSSPVPVPVPGPVPAPASTGPAGSHSAGSEPAGSEPAGSHRLFRDRSCSARVGFRPDRGFPRIRMTDPLPRDLVVDLVAPDGTAYRLKAASSSDSADDLNTTYSVNASAEAANGTWKLRVQDTAAQDTGRLNGWKLTF
ncbi:proprotein convertase P-domain-containing protein [Streptomyces rishiriensis]|uniref:proprotein convertase P-domain-containing protein n=1 Tax=Streptomyces rishiriensis TaxID=68264 RepID=UPI003F4CD96C